MRNRQEGANRERVKAARLGISGDLSLWLDVNRSPLAGSIDLSGMLAPFPPADLMMNTTGLTRQEEFAAHGVAMLQALARCSPKPLAAYGSMLDFGVGVGRLARMFQGFEGRYVGVDIDPRHVRWISENLAYVEALESIPREPLPLPANSFDGVISISVFTHLNEADQRFYLSELRRVAKPGAILFLTVHGEKALHRAETQDHIFEMLSIPRESVTEARRSFSEGPGFTFVRQEGHLTSEAYEYGITFISENYIKEVWSEYFSVLQVASGAIHDFQDIVVLKCAPKAERD